MKPEIKSVRKIIDIDLDGNVFEMPYSDALENDLKIMWAKDFWEKWSKPVFGKDFYQVFKDEDFTGQEGRAEYDGGHVRSKVVYFVYMVDGSFLYAEYDIDSNDGQVDIGVCDGDVRSLAYDFVKNQHKFNWDTDLLDSLVKDS